jgi:acylphosphatase
MTKKYIVYGRVQGVGFRYFVYQLAKKMKFSGSVKNLSDGSVEVVISGNSHREILEQIKVGNFFSRVDRIEEIGNIEKNYDDFEILY